MANNEEKRRLEPAALASYRARRKARAKRRLFKLLRYLGLLVLITLLFSVVASLAMPVLFGESAARETQTQQSGKTVAQAYIGDITELVYGSGSVQPVSQPGVYAQIDGTVLSVYGAMGDSVKAGDILAVLKNDALETEIAEYETALSEAQDAVEAVETYSATVERQIYWDDGRPRMDVDTGEPLTGTYSNELMIRAPLDGRVMAIYIEPGDDALAVYREHNAIMILSTDGKMKVELTNVESGLLTLGENVQVTGRNIDIAGKVISLTRQGTEAVIEVGSDEFAMNAQVSVKTQEGALVGEGVLAVNKPLAVSAYGGTISSVEVKIGQLVEKEDRLARFGLGEKPLYIDNASVLYDYAVALASLESAQAKKESLTIAAPCDGKIVSVSAKAGDEVTDGTLLMSLVEDGAGMEIILTVDELDIPYVQKGQLVTMTVDALNGTTITGEVQKIAPLGNTQSSVTTYDVYIRAAQIDERVLGGMNVSGEIAVKTVEGALLIPTDALLKDQEGYYVNLESGETARVTTGIMTVEATQILSGLAEGDAVVY